MTEIIKPLGNRIVVEPRVLPMEVKGGIIIPDKARVSSNEGTVVQLGLGKIDDNGNKIPFEMKIGEKVLYSLDHFTECRIDGKVYRVVDVSDVIAILD